MNSETKLLINLYSDANFLALNILENLLAKNCSVNIVSSNIKTWQEKTKNITATSRFAIFDRSKFTKIQKPNYNIYCDGFLDKDNVYKTLREFIFDNLTDNIKTLAILPFEIFDQNENSVTPMNNNLSLIYLGDLLGPRMDMESNLLMASSINEILNDKSLTLGVGEIFYPLFVNDAVKTLTKWLFSFGPYGKETFLLGSQISGSTLWQENQKLIPGVTINYDPDIKTRIVPRGYEITTLPNNVRFSLIETYKWLTKKDTKPQKPTKPPVVKKPKKPRTYPKFLQPLVITLSLIALAPFITLAISAGSFFMGYKQFVNQNDDMVKNLLLVAKTFAVTTKQASNLLKIIPVFGRVYKETAFAGSFGERISDIGVSTIPMVRTSSDFFNKILGNDLYDPTNLSSDLKSGLGSIYQSLSFLQLETKSESEKGILLAKFIASKFDFDRFRNILGHAESLVDGLPQVLGKGGSKTYLLLFQNNMELRPTGGFIGSYGLITFDNGRMSDLTVSDVYSADGQLNGHVEPPSPIKNYLGEANWWLRDSNWDPDFPTSAKRAEWFLDKEVARKVDGVIAIDLSPIKDILKYTGPIFLPDFNLDITDTNLYEKTQSEVQDNFFPGTHKKASFLTALSRNLISEISKIDGTKKAFILKAFFNNLESRHVQIYLHDINLQNTLSELFWDGSVVSPPDFVGLVEANVGVNKANYFITRKTDIVVTTTPTEIDKHLILTLKNSANPALDLAGKYKTYIRLLIPSDAEILNADPNYEIVNLQNRKEVGILVEVLGGHTKTIEFSWRTPNTDNYNLYVRKQAGIADDPISIVIDGRKVYNGLFVKDIWTKKF
ncbi:MAG TPA: DUF4012 domain-containing protein [Alphaproteobacteria bacterium]|jgi:hypothetical protein|nr:DUF4012 domain-containing protein [Alphaproteobacteria bacterium]